MLLALAEGKFNLSKRLSLEKTDVLILGPLIYYQKKVRQNNDALFVF